jgi:transcriptional regulator with PAS, ATPase and Fis domain
VNKKIERISDAAMKILENYDYQGNIRELMNIINSAVIIGSSSEIKKKCLPSYILEATAPVERDIADGPFKTMEEMEKDYIKKVLAAMEGNKTHTAQILNISRIGLISKIKKYKLE